MSKSNSFKQCKICGFNVCIFQGTDNKLPCDHWMIKGEDLKQRRLEMELLARDKRAEQIKLNREYEMKLKKKKTSEIIEIILQAVLEIGGLLILLYSDWRIGLGVFLVLISVNLNVNEKIRKILKGRFK